ncbi:TetR/AcrR family transcriptional regulator [Dactylosporangium roseum]|uniref:TetR/AcrR family transcriptional regulator n=1 Tax=Dactylosporangium roseum TaxID=47989 RepID=A0ABY5Z3J8_9ACTN|nr:TetR/AcrR family transcriptional regulator [Dactylosporangium roseum]UWZ36595.1 TetR/AcrR family transcriptional regulator [Dactylosporangium roseum]
MPRTGRPRTFDEDHVINGAKDVFWRRGYAATSLRDLKDELGVLPGSLYGAFGDKHALFLRALQRYADDTRVAASAVLADGPLLPRISELLRNVLAAARTAPGRGCMLGNTAAELLPDDEAAGRVVSGAFSTLEHAIEQALAVAQRTGEIRADVDCAAQARLLVVLMQGLHVVARTEPDPHRLDDVVHIALASLTPTHARAAECTGQTRRSARP